MSINMQKTDKVLGIHFNNEHLVNSEDRIIEEDETEEDKIKTRESVHKAFEKERS